LQKDSHPKSNLKKDLIKFQFKRILE